MLGFVIVSHNRPDQLLRLCNTLARVYGDPPIACHHDTQQTLIDKGLFGKNVTFVDQPNQTGWGEWNVTSGVLLGLRLLYRQGNPEWFTLLSAADYPVRPAARVMHELEQSKVDAFMDLRPVEGMRPVRHCGEPDPNLAHHDNLRLATKRYLHARLPTGVNERGQSRTLRLPFRSMLSPFNRDYLCYVGSQWFTANRRCAQVLIDLSDDDRRAMQYLRSRWHADECFINTVLGNNPDLSININPRRYTKWKTSAASPGFLEVEDLRSVVSSEAHFARKFSLGSSAIQAIDKTLLE